MNLEVKIHEPPQRTVMFATIKTGEMFLLPCDPAGTHLCLRTTVWCDPEHNNSRHEATAVIEMKTGKEITGITAATKVIPLANVRIEGYVDMAKRDERQLALTGGAADMMAFLKELAVITALVIFIYTAAVATLVFLDSKPVIDCSTDTECMEMHGGDGGPGR